MTVYIEVVYSSNSVKYFGQETQDIYSSLLDRILSVFLFKHNFI